MNLYYENVIYVILFDVLCDLMFCYINVIFVVWKTYFKLCLLVIQLKYV